MNAFLSAYTIHIAAVCLSGSFFLLRGIWMIQENTLLEKKIVRIAPHVIDTVLLVSGVVLAVLVQQYPGVDSWLTVKVLALIAYIVLGVFALRRGKTKTARVSYMAAAIAVFGFMVSVSLTRSPLGFLTYF
ncbi:MAG: SirB2 family protein [Gammaproteobacteria bacterium]|nr:SirB2 family protein [Gammaproteobacteria bacterium]